MKSKIITTLSIIFITLSFFSFKQKVEIVNGEDDIVATWWNEEKTSKIKIYKNTAGKIYGKIVWLADPNDKDGKPRTDVNNPDESKRSQALLNLVILKNFTYVEEDKWEDGEIYDPTNGKTYSCEMELSEDGKELDITGYIGFTWIGRTSTFTKVE